jgi:predicted homoserine dehydrogenase-like protein
MLAAVLAIATPVQAAEPCDEACTVTCRTVVVNAGDDENLVALDECEGAKVITPVKAGEYLTYENCVPDDSFIVTQIRKRLDQSDARLHRL